MRDLKRWLLVAGTPLLAAGGGGEGGDGCGEGVGWFLLCIVMLIGLGTAYFSLPLPKDDKKTDQK